MTTSLLLYFLIYKMGIIILIHTSEHCCEDEVSAIGTVLNRNLATDTKAAFSVSTLSVLQELFQQLYSHKWSPVGLRLIPMGLLLLNVLF